LFPTCAACGVLMGPATHEQFPVPAFPARGHHDTPPRSESVPSTDDANDNEEDEEDGDGVINDDEELEEEEEYEENDDEDEQEEDEEESSALLRPGLGEAGYEEWLINNSSGVLRQNIQKYSDADVYKPLSMPDGSTPEEIAIQYYWNRKIIVRRLRKVKEHPVFDPNLRMGSSSESSSDSSTETSSDESTDPPPKKQPQAKKKIKV